MRIKGRTEEAEEEEEDVGRAAGLQVERGRGLDIEEGGVWSNCQAWQRRVAGGC